MERTEIQLFSFGQTEFRVVQDEQGEPWFAAKDVCRVLGLNNVSFAVNGNEKTGNIGLAEDEKGIMIIDTLGGKQQLLFVSESGLYSLIFKSQKPEARDFQKHVTREVLPTIRKTGSYGTAPAALPTPTELALLVIESERQKAALEARTLLLETQNAKLAPKAEQYTAFLNTNGCILLGDFAKASHLVKDGKRLGRNTVFNILREIGVFFGHPAQPKQQYIQCGYFDVKQKERPSNSAEDGYKMTVQTYLLPQGQPWLYELLKTHGYTAETSALRLRA